MFSESKGARPATEARESEAAQPGTRRWQAREAKGR